MQTLPSNTPPTFMEKVLRALPFILLGVAVFWFWGTISAFVVMTLENTLKATIYGVILAAILLFGYQNSGFLWMGYKTLCRKITSFFIKMDPLSFMDRYADILTEKLRKVNAARVNLKGEKVDLERQIATEKKTMEQALKLGAAAMQTGNKAQASLQGQRAKGAENSIKLYMPNLLRMERSIAFMDTLAENWEVSIISMREEIERKRTEFRILKKNAAALNQAEAFLKGDTEEGRIYQESIRALEASVSQKIAYIEDFEQRAKPVLEGAKVQNQMQVNEGLEMLEQYMRDDKLLLPDFTKIGTIDLPETDYQVVGSKFKFNG